MSDTAAPAAPVRSILFPANAGTAAEPLRGSLRRNAVYADVHRALDGLRGAGLDLVEQQIAHQADAMLGTTVVDVLVAGWRKHGELVAAARATADDPGRTIDVDLGHLPIAVTHAWTVDVAYGPLRASIDFTLAVAADVDPVLAVVRHGRLVALGDGRCTVHVTFSAGRRPIAARDAVVPLGVHVDLRGGIPLVGTRAAEGPTRAQRPPNQGAPTMSR